MNLSMLWGGIKNGFKALRNGEFLLRIRADKYYMHIMYLFLLMWMTILLSLQVDKTLSRVGDNKVALERLRIHHAEKEAALVKLHSASAAETRLRELGSEARLPQEPATVIKTR
jgi:hypothetical protein